MDHHTLTDSVLNTERATAEIAALSDLIDEMMAERIARRDDRKGYVDRVRANRAHVIDLERELRGLLAPFTEAHGIDGGEIAASWNPHGWRHAANVPGWRVCMIADGCPGRATWKIVRRDQYFIISTEYRCGDHIDPEVAALPRHGDADE